MSVSDYSEWLVFTDWRYRAVYTVDHLAHKLFGDGDLRWAWLCNLERDMYYRRWELADRPTIAKERTRVRPPRIRPHNH